jgi:RNA polymerase sigma-70 factor, ECF subfamily
LSSPQDSIEVMARDQDWAALIGRMAEGDQAAMGSFYDATSRLIFGLVLRILGDRPTAEEVLIDVYTQVWRQAGAYDGGRGTPLAWLTTIARSRALDRLRAGWQEQQRRQPIEELQDAPDQAASPEDDAVTTEHQRLVRAALAALSPEQRQVIELAYYSGLSHSEIAAHLNQPLGTVKTRTRLGMLKLREALRPILHR